MPILLILLIALLSIKHIPVKLNVHQCKSIKYPETCDKINELLVQTNNICNNCLNNKSGKPVYITADDIDDKTLGLAQISLTECIVTINPINTSLYQTLIHELGHCKGWEHVDDDKHVMYYEENEVDEKTLIDFIKRL